MKLKSIFHESNFDAKHLKKNSGERWGVQMARGGMSHQQKNWEKKERG